MLNICENQVPAAAGRSPAPRYAGGLPGRGTRHRSHADQVRPGRSSFPDAGQRIDRAVLADSDGINVCRPIPIFIKDGAMVDVMSRGNVIGDQVQISSPLASPFAVLLLPAILLPSA